MASGESIGAEIGISDGFSGDRGVDVCDSTDEIVERLVVNGAEVDVMASVNKKNGLELWKL